MHIPRRFDWRYERQNAMKWLCLLQPSAEVHKHSTAPSLPATCNSKNQLTFCEEQSTGFIPSFAPSKMSYRTRSWVWASSLSSLPFRLDKLLFWLPSNWNLSFGFWLRYTIDGPGAPPSMTTVRSPRSKLECPLTCTDRKQVCTSAAGRRKTVPLARATSWVSWGRD